MNDTIPFFAWQTTPLELLSFVLSVLTVLLNIRQIHWAWLFSILSSALYGVVFFLSRLYGDSGLQLVFVLASVYGWYCWLHGDDQHKALPVTSLTLMQRFAAVLAWLVGFVILSLFLKSFTDTDVPYMDGFLTAGSLVGQLLLSRKKIENWSIWIVVDVLYVSLYLSKGLMLTAILYGIFVVLAAIGLKQWSTACRA
ncbi:nicotinamide riboside transporter PnuC [Undibacterium rugosum]|uniref:Nicotinamide riboside transporter PnuC n=1 Tax=Undibacterium rugosum TaxID=2762291 RepID=A0A923I1F2_9BURK|nr:nicotinamide riboside transporter PnuC [Undibacterium rugosum]MBC3934600.1 nicotinamide mononucleotide transporter [Undibacterium rugosum]MBR7777214.1 nicotinamide mononucleotide transporter [Undibacterium rugosum]